MRKIASALILSVLFAAALPGGETETLKRPVIRYTGEMLSGPTVEETGEFAELNDPNAGNIRDIPKNSYAARLAQPGRRYHWVPSPDTLRPTGGVQVAGTAISADGSLLAVLESVGASRGVKRTRVIFFNTYNGEVIRALDYSVMRRFDRAAFVPGTWLLALAETAQPELKDSRNTLELVNLRSRKGSARTVPLAGPVSGMAVMDKLVILKYADRPELVVVRAEDDAGEPEVAVTAARFPGGMLVAAPDGKSVINAGPKRADRYQVREGELFFRETDPLPENFNPQFGLAVDAAADTYILCETRGDAYLLTGGRFVRMSSGCGRVIAEDKRAGDVLLGLEKNQAIGVFRPLESARIRMTVTPNRQVPRTRGEIIQLGFLPPERRVTPVVAYDSRGNLMKLMRTGRRWSKVLLYSPPGELPE